MLHDSSGNAAAVPAFGVFAVAAAMQPVLRLVHQAASNGKAARLATRHTQWAVQAPLDALAATSAALPAEVATEIDGCPCDAADALFGALVDRCIDPNLAWPVPARDSAW